MSDGKIITRLVLFLIGAIALVFITRLIISSGSVPPLSRFTATSTQRSQGSATSSVSTGIDAASTGSNTPAILQPQSSLASDSPLSPLYPLSTISIKAPKGIITAEVATSDAAQEQGLGDRASMSAGHGMLFVFQSPGIYGFWMKDMGFPLDMVWIGQDKTVVSVTPDISPDTYPSVFFPPSDISHVLEINAGAAQSLGIVKGSTLVFK